MCIQADVGAAAAAAANVTVRDGNASATRCVAGVAGCGPCLPGFRPDNVLFHLPNCAMMDSSIPIAVALLGSASTAFAATLAHRAATSRPKSPARLLCALAATSMAFTLLECVAWIAQDGAFEGFWVCMGLNVFVNFAWATTMLTNVLRPIAAMKLHGAASADIVNRMQRRMRVMTVVWGVLECGLGFGAAATSRGDGDPYNAIVCAFILASGVANVGFSWALSSAAGTLKTIIEGVSANVKAVTVTMEPAVSTTTTTPSPPTTPRPNDDMQRAADRMEFASRFARRYRTTSLIMPLLVALYVGLGSIPFAYVLFFLQAAAFINTVSRTTLRVVVGRYVSAGGGTSSSAGAAAAAASPTASSRFVACCPCGPSHGGNNITAYSTT